MHGGTIITFVDAVLGHSVFTATGRRCSTVALASQFATGLLPVRGSKRRARIRKLSKRLAVLDAEAKSSETPLLTATASDVLSWRFAAS